jgi:hypothetical protein
VGSLAVAHRRSRGMHMTGPPPWRCSCERRRSGPRQGCNLTGAHGGRTCPPAGRTGAGHPGLRASPCTLRGGDSGTRLREMPPGGVGVRHRRTRRVYDCADGRRGGYSIMGFSSFVREPRRRRGGFVGFLHASNTASPEQGGRSRLLSPSTGEGGDGLHLTGANPLRPRGRSARRSG